MGGAREAEERACAAPGLGGRGPGGKRGRGGGRRGPRTGTGPGAEPGALTRRARRMCAGPALRQEYRRGLERGRARPGPDPSFGERLRQRLRNEPGLLPALQDDAGALLARGLRGRREPGASLRCLSAAFELLERTALNLYLFPWRKEFRTIQVGAGPGPRAGGVRGLRASGRRFPSLLLLADLLGSLRTRAAGGAARSRAAAELGPAGLRAAG